jgi:nitrate/TMAO reductase-like tetraheme cytochrome c subunit
MKLPEMTRRNQILLIVGLLVVLIPSFFIYDYTQNNPRFCTTCHLMNPAYETWTVSAMHDLACHKCHETDMVESLGHVVEVLTRNPDDVTKEVDIDNSLCESCHISNDPNWLQIADTAGHKVHIYESAGYAECIDCHGQRLHVFEPPEETCVQCHDVENTVVETLMGTHCITCHEFTATDHELIPVDQTCLQCHEEQDSMGASFPADIHTDTACINCHNPHEEDPFPDCTSCHAEGGGLHIVPSHDDCTSCHIPHSENGLRENCVSCHVDKDDHYTPILCSACHGFS